jgi:hypothetical protein
MLQTKGLRFLTILAAGMLLATAAPGQDDERSAFRDKQFDAVRAEMTKITTAIQENVKGFLGSADQPRKRTRAAIEAFHEEVMKLYAQLDKPRADIDKLHDEIQAQYDQAIERYEQAIAKYDDAIEAHDNAMEAYQDAMDAQDEIDEKNTDPSNAPDMASQADTAPSADKVEPLPAHLELKSGDAVVVLRDADLKVGQKVVGNSRRGERLVVGQVQGKWVSLRSGATSGWIDKRSVVSATLADWYQRLPDNESVEAAGRTRAKLRGVLFDISNAGPRGNLIDANVDYADPFTFIQYGKVTVFLEQRRGDRDWAVSLSFGPSTGWSGGLVPPPHVRGRPYGTIMQGDYVFIDTGGRLVLVNGERRRLQ